MDSLNFAVATKTKAAFDKIKNRFSITIYLLRFRSADKA